MPFDRDFETIWASVHQYARSQNYRGFNKHDGLNSPILNLLFGWGYWPRIIAIQGVMRFPINIRPCLMTKKVYNPKGLSLFIRSLLHAFEANKNEAHLQEARLLLDLLVKIRESTGSGAWGYHYPWQDAGFFAPPQTPNAVVTAFVAKAFLHAYRVTKDNIYLDEVQKAIVFFVNDLQKLWENENEVCLSYMPLKMSMRVMDVSILIASVIAQYEKYTGERESAHLADRLVNYVVNRQTDYGAWFYTDPPEHSHLIHDNYHTGFILDALHEYMKLRNDFSYKARYQIGLKFYADNLFKKDGAPKWMSHVDFPYDVHGAAQGIITFSRHLDEFPGLATKIANWSIDNLYSGKGYFYYQKNKYYRKKFTLLRWCNAWMCYALSCLLFRADYD